MYLSTCMFAAAAGVLLQNYLELQAAIFCMCGAASCWFECIEVF